jgi:hypothetical protein
MTTEFFVGQKNGIKNGIASGLAMTTGLFVWQNKCQHVRPCQKPLISLFTKKMAVCSACVQPCHNHLILHSPKNGLRKKDGIKNY